jgi:hypothetical protein
MQNSRNDTQQNSRLDVTAPSLPVQQKTLFGSSAVVIVAAGELKVNQRREALHRVYRLLIAAGEAA